MHIWRRDTAPDSSRGLGMNGEGITPREGESSPTLGAIKGEGEIRIEAHVRACTHVGL